MSWEKFDAARKDELIRLRALSLKENIRLNASKYLSDRAAHKSQEAISHPSVDTFQKAAKAHSEAAYRDGGRYNEKDMWVKDKGYKGHEHHLKAAYANAKQGAILASRSAHDVETHKLAYEAHMKAKEYAEERDRLDWGDKHEEIAKSHFI